jgi:hypothetical protein
LNPDGVTKPEVPVKKDFRLFFFLEYCSGFLTSIYAFVNPEIALGIPGFYYTFLAKEIHGLLWRHAALCVSGITFP